MKVPSRFFSRSQKRKSKPGTDTPETSPTTTSASSPANSTKAKHGSPSSSGHFVLITDNGNSDAGSDSSLELRSNSSAEKGRVSEDSASAGCSHEKRLLKGKGKEMEVAPPVPAFPPRAGRVTTVGGGESFASGSDSDVFVETDLKTPLVKEEEEEEVDSDVEHENLFKAIVADLEADLEAEGREKDAEHEALVAAILADLEADREEDRKWKAKKAAAVATSEGKSAGKGKGEALNGAPMMDYQSFDFAVPGASGTHRSEVQLEVDGDECSATCSCESNADCTEEDVETTAENKARWSHLAILEPDFINRCRERRKHYVAGRLDDLDVDIEHLQTEIDELKKVKDGIMAMVGDSRYFPAGTGEEEEEEEEYDLGPCPVMTKINEIWTNFESWSCSLGYVLLGYLVFVVEYGIRVWNPFRIGRELLGPDFNGKTVSGMKGRVYQTLSKNFLPPKTLAAAIATQICISSGYYIYNHLEELEYLYNLVVAGSRCARGACGECNNAQRWVRELHILGGFVRMDARDRAKAGMTDSWAIHGLFEVLFWCFGGAAMYLGIIAIGGAVLRRDKIGRLWVGTKEGVKGKTPVEVEEDSKCIVDAEGRLLRNTLAELRSEKEWVRKLCVQHAVQRPATEPVSKCTCE